MALLEVDPDKKYLLFFQLQTQVTARQMTAIMEGLKRLEMVHTNIFSIILPPELQLSKGATSSAKDQTDLYDAIKTQVFMELAGDGKLDEEAEAEDIKHDEAELDEEDAP